MVCDQCVLKHRKCSREHPVCARCMRLKLDCTWNKPRSYQTGGIHDKVLTVLQQPKYLRRKCKVTKPEKFSSYKGSRYQKEGHIGHVNKTIVGKLEPHILVRGSRLYLTPGFWDWTTRKWSCKVAFRISFSSFIRTCGVTKSLTKSEQETICKIFLFKCKSSPASTASFDAYSLLRTSFLIEAATLSFFQHYNNSYPLFTLQGFMNKSRSYLLKLAVCNIGLRFMPPSVLRDALIKNTENEIIERLLPSKLSFTLDTVQIIMVYQVGSCWRVANTNVFSYLRIAATILKSLGVDRNLPSFCLPDYRFELELAFREMDRIDFYLFLQGPSYFHIQYWRPLSKLYCHLYEHKLIIKLGWFTGSRIILDRSQQNSAFGLYEEVLYLIDTECSDRAGSIIKHTAFFINTNPELDYEQIIELALSCEKKVKFIFRDAFEKISFLYNFFIKYTVLNFTYDYSTDHILTRCTLMAMKTWVMIAIRAYSYLLRVQDFIPIPSGTCSKSHKLFFTSTQSRLIYVTEIIRNLERIKTKYSFINFHSFLLMLVSRITLNQLNFLAGYVGPKNSALKPYLECLQQTASQFKDLTKTHLHSHFANSYLKVLKMLLASSSVNQIDLSSVKKLIECEN